MVMESNLLIKKSNAVLLYILLRFPDGLKEQDLYYIIKVAQKLKADQYGTNIIGDSSLAPDDECIGLVSDTIKKLKNKAERKMLDDVKKKVKFENSYIFSDFSLYNEYLTNADIETLDTAIKEFWDFKPNDN